MRLGNIELGAGLPQILRQQFADRHSNQGRAGDAGALRLAAGAKDRCLAPNRFLDVECAGIADQQMPMAW